MNHLSTTVAIAALSIFLSGCGGGTTSTSTPTGSTNSAPTLASAVADQTGRVGFDLT